MHSNIWSFALLLLSHAKSGGDLSKHHAALNYVSAGGNFVRNMRAFIKISAFRKHSFWVIIEMKKKMVQGNCITHTMLDNFVRLMKFSNL